MVSASVTFASSTVVDAPVRVVWDVMTDHVRWARWGTSKRVTIERAGVPSPNGLGAIRCFHAGPVKVREEVTAWEAPRRMVYRLNTTTMTRSYESEMVLVEGHGTGGVPTTLEWSSTFVPRVPGTAWFVRRMFERAVQGFAAGIRREAEAEAQGGSPAAQEDAS